LGGSEPRVKSLDLGAKYCPGLAASERAYREDLERIVQEIDAA
jgi:hypothetical protein